MSRRASHPIVSNVLSERFAGRRPTKRESKGHCESKGDDAIVVR
jgi:hypothetical protein